MNRQAGITALIDALNNFANVPKNCIVCCVNKKTYINFVYRIFQITDIAVKQSHSHNKQH